jgi:uncharacterized membrane protein YfcA
MARVESREPFILHDRVLLAALMFGSSGYIVVGSWAGAALLVAGFMMGAVWAFRTASNHPERKFRLLATLLLVMLGAFMTIYVASNQGIIR